MYLMCDKNKSASNLHYWWLVYLGKQDIMVVWNNHETNPPQHADIHTLLVARKPLTVSAGYSLFVFVIAYAPSYFISNGATMKRMLYVTWCTLLIFIPQWTYCPYVSIFACRRFYTNQLSGTIPSELGALSRLTTLCVEALSYAAQTLPQYCKCIWPLLVRISIDSNQYCVQGVHRMYVLVLDV